MPSPFSKSVYWTSKTIAEAAIDQLLMGDMAGLSNVPDRGPCILAVNHASHLDPPLIGCKLRRELSFFARRTLWIGGLFSWWLDSVGTIPVDRDGDSDLGAMKATLQTLKNGGLLTLFPEGTRSRDGQLQPAKPGIGLIAARSQAIVVPCRIFNSHKVLPRDRTLPNLDLRIHAVYGKPLGPEQYDPGASAGKRRFQLIADRIMEAIAELKRPRQRAL